MYYHFEEPVQKLAGHRILALNRGEKEKILTVKVQAPKERILSLFRKESYCGTKSVHHTDVCVKP